MWRSIIFISLALCSLGANAAGLTSTVPKPKWVLDYAPNSCVLTRARSAAEGGLIIESRPYETDRELTLLLPKVGQRIFMKSGHLSVPDSRRSVINYITVEEPKGGADRTVNGSISNEQLAELSTQPTLAVTIPGKLDERVSTTGFGKALLALKSCEQNLAEKWGTPKNWVVDPIPKADPLTAFRSEDYPSAMVAANIQGDVRLLVKISPSGEVLACRSIDRNEQKAFGEVVCAVFRKRVSFTPAKNAARQAVESFYVTPRVRFMLQ
jgi:TonB family protein